MPSPPPTDASWTRLGGSTMTKLFFVGDPGVDDAVAIRLARSARSGAARARTTRTRPRAAPARVVAALALVAAPRRQPPRGRKWSDFEKKFPLAPPAG